MRAAIIEEPGEIVVREFPDPIPEKDEVLIKIQYCGICGSDLHEYKYGVYLIPGHELSGDIVEAGADVKGLKVGDRVTFEPNNSCGKCFWCKNGKTELCEMQFEDLGQSTGAFATYTKAKHIHLSKLPDRMSYEEAALVEPTACALHAIRQIEIQKGDVVAVLGLGAIGQLTARLAKISGARAVYATDISPSRIALARDAVDEVIDANTTNPVERILELTGGMGTDIVFECAGTIPTTQQSMAMVRKAGTILIVAICFDWVNLPASNIMLRELNIGGSVGFTAVDFADSLSFIENQKIDVAPLITHKMPLDEISKAFEMATRGEGCKILIKP